MHPLAEAAFLSRREFFTTAAGGVGGLALAALLASEAKGEPGASATGVLRGVPPVAHAPGCVA